MSFAVKSNITWVGKQDWELREFHGAEYSTHKGSSYNSYLVREEKVALIDTVWSPYAQEFVDNLEKEIDLHKIDYIIANHAEIDHSGALPALLARIPDTPIYCTENGVKSLKGHFHKDWNFKVVKTGDTLDLGNGKQFVFVEAPMLHWPDSMMTYLAGDAVLFSNDAFGQHYASEQMFNDLVDQEELRAECLKYYANILTPFSARVTAKIHEVLSFKLPLEMICTSHGIIWRDNPAQIVEQYLAWADDYQENQITLIYDTMWNGTRQMAEAITKGIRSADPSVEVKMFNLAISDKNDVLTQVFKSKGILVGSPTVNNGMLPQVAALLEEMRGLRFRGKHAASFGSHGWSGGAVDRIGQRLEEAGFKVSGGIEAVWKPTDGALDECLAFGRRIAQQWRGEHAPVQAGENAPASAFARSPARPAANPVAAATATPNVVAADGGSMRCRTCGWVYDPAKGESGQGVHAGTPWSAVPETFLCPECLLGKSEFEPLHPHRDGAADASRGDGLQPAPVVIIGGGSATYQLVRAFRAQDQDTPVLVITADAGADYPKPQLVHGFSRKLGPSDLVQRSPEELAREFNVTIKTHTRVDSIDAEAKTISFGGEIQPYRDLVLALGATPWIPPLEGNAVDRVITLNNLSDYETYLHQLSRGTRVLVIGAGLTGTEVALDLAEGGQQVWLTDVAPRTLAKVLPEFVSQELEARLVQKGCRLHLGQNIVSIDSSAGGVTVRLSDGETFEVDTVLVAAGVRPRVELAKAAGLQVNRGIQVDPQLQSSSAHIYALGDCAEIEGRVLPFMHPLSLAAQALAKTLAGERTGLRLPAMPTMVKTPAMPIQVGGVTVADGLQWTVEADETGLTGKAVNDEGEFVGYVVTGKHLGNGMALLQQLPALL
ncbi:anaerobic nitric oxide reductase flavorubredoxin [Aromatoleum buckelii]|uniref:Anaerobic nitric oxide reductase flavorubredoxin n=1 Tax=Aromatoleum buckelii TaxID=200254 RepID=A0ABX1MY22_9RHOO|nr:anaerobic nitric oxide reductase flavorubredoxin [Aromatoleum buckelii]MCK0512401.1 anaerobic nitric oxide reductase flavorubredoxin [Aromatoleum buckelii]